MRFIFLLVATLLCVACSPAGYFPAKPASAIEVVDPGRGALGFVTEVPTGWKESLRVVTPHERLVEYENDVLASSMAITLSTSHVVARDSLKDDLAQMRTAGWKPGKMESLGSEGMYFFATRAEKHRFVGVRTYTPCGTELICTVSIDVAWPKASERDVHAAIRQTVTTFRFSR